MLQPRTGMPDLLSLHALRAFPGMVEGTPPIYVQKAILSVGTIYKRSTILQGFSLLSSTFITHRAHLEPVMPVRYYKRYVTMPVGTLRAFKQLRQFVVPGVLFFEAHYISQPVLARTISVSSLFRSLHAALSAALRISSFPVSRYSTIKS